MEATTVRRNCRTLFMTDRPRKSEHIFSRPMSNSPPPTSEDNIGGLPIEPLHCVPTHFCKLYQCLCGAGLPLLARLLSLLAQPFSLFALFAGSCSQVFCILQLP